MTTLLAITEVAVAWMKGAALLFFLATWIVIALRLLRRSERWTEAANLPLADDLSRSSRHGHG